MSRSGGTRWETSFRVARSDAEGGAEGAERDPAGARFAFIVLLVIRAEEARGAAEADRRAAVAHGSTAKRGWNGHYDLAENGYFRLTLEWLISSDQQ